MNRNRIPAWIGATALMALPGMALAAPLTLKSALQLDKVVEDASGKHHLLVVPARVVPGDHLVFTTAYTNTSPVPVANFVVTNPLPREVALVDDGSGQFEVSVDGGISWGKLAALSMDDGRGGKRPAQAGDVSHVRWTLSAIAPGGSGKLEYRAVVR